MPLAIPSTGEVRAMLWLLPLHCMGSAAMLASPIGPNWTRWIGTAILLIVLGMQSYRILRIPTQPIREAIAEARSLAGSEGRVIGVYMAASEARILYGGIDAVAYCAGPSPSPATASMPSLRDAESGSEGATIGVVFYESFVRRSEPELWEQLQQRYELVARFPGRTSPAAVYRRRNP